jgi:hypothetical protein
VTLAILLQGRSHPGEAAVAVSAAAAAGDSEAADGEVGADGLQALASTNQAKLFYIFDLISFFSRFFDFFHYLLNCSVVNMLFRSFVSLLTR